MAGGFGMRRVKGLGWAGDPNLDATARPFATEPRRDGAAPRGHGFSQRDVFEPARRTQRAEMIGQPAPVPRAVAQESVRQGPPVAG